MKKVILIIIFCFVASIVSAETVRVVYRADKSVVIIVPSKGGDYNVKALDCMKSDGLENMPYDDVDNSLLPQTRVNRNAWEGEKGKPVAINAGKIIPKPKTIEQRVTELEAKATEIKP